MGGMAGGATASRMAVQAITEYVSRPTSEDDIADDNRLTLIKAIQYANQQLLAYTVDHPELKDMGTTVTALLINETKATVAHVGDSRIYQLRGRKKVFRTFDHSMVFEMVKNKVITEEQARLSAQSNIILRAVGLKEELDVEARDLSYKKGDRFFQCTDGIWGTMPEKELIRRISQDQHPKVITESLAMFVNGEGKKQGSHHDNLSASLVFTTANSTFQEKKGFFSFLFH
jgi:serine/threonine protein phosphatase PrpC